MKSVRLSETSLAWCHRCQKPVDEQFIMRREFDMGFTVGVRCHGDTDECVVSAEFVMVWSCTDAHLERFEAFRDKELPELRNALPEPPAS